MTTQTQLMKIIEKRRWLRAAKIFNKENSANDYIPELATAILSAMKIDDVKLMDILSKETGYSFNDRMDITYIIASHAQEIIKFKEDKQ